MTRGHAFNLAWVLLGVFGCSSLGIAVIAWREAVQERRRIRRLGAGERRRDDGCLSDGERQEWELIERRWPETADEPDAAGGGR